jgi:hypothetical protein
MEAAPEPAAEEGAIRQGGFSRCSATCRDPVCLRIRRLAPLALLFVAALMLVVFEPLQKILFSTLGALAIVAVLYMIYLAATDPRRLARETAHVGTRVVSRVETIRETIVAEQRRAHDASKPKPLTDVQALLQGADLTKYGRSGVPCQRFLWIRLRGSALEVCWAESSRSRRTANTLLLSEVIEVVEGRQTETFQRHGLNMQGEERCFSLVAVSRTLDLQAAERQTAQLWVATLRDLIAKHQSGTGASAAATASPQQELLPVSSTMSSSG